MDDLENILTALADERPLFHSEADFQHALAWHIHENYTDAKVRLEYPAVGSKGRIYLDIYVELGEKRIGIELKYKTKSYEAKIGDDLFKLKNQGAHDVARYDLSSDLMRLEGLLESEQIDYGYVVFLTNDLSYCNDTGRTGRMDEDFRIHENNSLSGILRWAKHTSAGTMKGHENEIQLNGSYHCRWSFYSEGDNHSFKYLFLKLIK
ncbi:hypothetical protein GYB29_03480 [bacterium]|nr:hypothetical protein [bacterium]